MKVFIFILNSEKAIYSFTIDKDIRDTFQIQRNMKLFTLKTVEMDKYEYMIFSNKNSFYMLSKDFLDDGVNNFEIVATTKESSSLSESCEYITNTASYFLSNMNKYPIKNKYLKTIEKITKNITNSEDKHPTLNINTFALFYHLFRNTFSEYELPNSPDLSFLISYDEE